MNREDDRERGYDANDHPKSKDSHVPMIPHRRRSLTWAGVPQMHRERVIASSV
jgi:hypothetical protein